MQMYLFAVSCLITSAYCRPQYEGAFHLEPSVQFLSSLDPETYLIDAFLQQNNRRTPRKVAPHPWNLLDFAHAPKDGAATVTLVLKPSAKAIAGSYGRAIATPQSRAVLKPGTNVDVLFQPDAVAVAGPGGVAHAESDLEIVFDKSL